MTFKIKKTHEDQWLLLLINNSEILWLEATIYLIEVQGI